MRKLIKQSLVDIVSSDAHIPGAYENLLRSYRYIQKKCGDTVAEQLFWTNANSILKKETG